MTGIATWLMRRAAAVLLVLCVASPALAEVHCAWDTATHFADAAHHDVERAPDGGEAERDTHCAFSHGHGSLASGSVAPGPPARVAAFTRPGAAIFVSSIPPGLDRPPRA